MVVTIMMCDLCKELTPRTIRAGLWHVCQSCVSNGAVERAIEVEFDIAKLQEAVVQMGAIHDLRDKTAAEIRLEVAYDAYAALMTAMSDLAVCTVNSRESHLLG